jgi:membrane-associated protease RseP (regulator of RpoE activity)
MQIPPESVRPVAWLEGASPPVGRIVLPIGPDGRPLNVGVVSVAVRKLVDPQEPNYEAPLRIKADRPPLGGTVKDGKYIVGWVRGLAKAAGILPGDRLFSIAGHRITSEDDVARPDDVAKSVGEKQSGDIVPVVVVRGWQALSFELPLLPAVKVGAWNRTWRCDDFPIALEYAPPVGTAACGGPIVDTSGRVVGVTVGQTTDATGWAIPADEVQRIVDDAKEGKLASWIERGASD